MKIMSNRTQYRWGAVAGIMFAVGIFTCTAIPLAASDNNEWPARVISDLQEGDYYTDCVKYITDSGTIDFAPRSKSLIKEKKVFVSRGKTDSVRYLIEETYYRNEHAYAVREDWYYVSGNTLIVENPEYLSSITLTAPGMMSDTVFGEWEEPTDTSSQRNLVVKSDWNSLRSYIKETPFRAIEKYFAICLAKDVAVLVSEHVYATHKQIDTICVYLFHQGGLPTDGFGSLRAGRFGFIKGRKIWFQAEWRVMGVKGKL